MADFSSLQTSVQSSLVATTRAVSSLTAEDLQFHRSLDRSIGTHLEAQNARLLSLAQRLLGSATTNSEAVRPSLKDIDDVETNWTKVVDVIDSLLERADTALDEFTGAIKKANPKEIVANAKAAQRTAASFRDLDIAKPQLLFDNQIDNDPRGAFKPLLTSKPHSSVPLQRVPSRLEGQVREGYEHPYQQEIERFAYPTSLYDAVEPSMYTPFAETEATLVDTEEALEEMIQELKSAKEIAVDLEHHDQRSYIGIVCLMQISTRDRDWIIDTLQPWRRKLSRLNEVFTDPSIVKVLHGAHMDIIWLQRDLGVYVVGLFDTYSAARALGYPAASYAYLLRKWTGVEAQKQYQTADWRIRPLPQELVDYARSDTHYLLWVYDNMRNELIERSDFSVANHEKDKIHAVQEASKETALQRYEYPRYDPEFGQGAVGWYKILSRTPAMFTKEQFAVFRAVHQWRDTVAREQDDSPFFVMQHHAVFTIAKAMPETKVELLKLAQPPTQTLKLRADELVAEIVKAKHDGAEGPEMMDILNQFDPISAKKLANYTQADRSGQQINGVSNYLSRAFGVDKQTGSSILSSLPLRSLTSMFWGASLKQDSDQQKRQLTTHAVQMLVPLPPLTADVFAESAQPIAVKSASPQPTPLLPHTTTEDEDIFTLKELGRKRKLVQSIDDGDGMRDQADEVVLLDEQAQEQEALVKAERKRAKKEAKRTARTTSQEQTGNDRSAQEEPFDYAAAPSVLHQPAQDKVKKQGKKSFSPYSKSMDAPKGLPRVQKESAGKSMTYAR